MSRAALIEQHMVHVARQMTARARRGVFDASTGLAAEAYLRTCSYDDVLTQSRLVFTRERSDGESLWHLSISALPRFIIGPGEDPAVALDVAIVREWPRVFFASAMRLVIAQEPKGERAQRLGAWHWRLYCNPQWQAIAPRAASLEESVT